MATITITATKANTTKAIEYSLDGVTFQASNVFANVAPGAYASITARLVGTNKIYVWPTPVQVLSGIVSPVIVDGHSINTPWPSQTGDYLSDKLEQVLGTTNYTFTSVANPGQYIENQLDRLRNGGTDFETGQPIVGTTVPSRTSTTPGVVVVYGLINNLDRISGLRNAGDTAAADAELAQAKLDFAAYCNEVRAKNYKLIILEEAAASSGGYSTARNNLWLQEIQNWNAYLLTQLATLNISLLVRTMTYPEFADASATLNPAIYSDRVHFVDNGRGVLAVKVAPAIPRALAGEMGGIIAYVATAGPTAPVTNDTNNTFNWTDAPGSPANEQTLDGGATYTALSAKPLVVGDVNKAAGQVGVRVAAVGATPASATLFNTVPFTVAAGPTPLEPGGTVQHNQVPPLVYQTQRFDGGTFSGTTGAITYPTTWGGNRLKISFIRDGEAASVDVMVDGQVVGFYECRIAAGPAADFIICEVPLANHNGFVLGRNGGTSDIYYFVSAEMYTE